MPEDTRVITLTNHRPIRITDSAWPIICRSDWRDAPRGQETHRQWLLIRQHADGRIIVYGGMDSNDTGDVNRAGEMLRQGDPLVPAIRRVAAAISRMTHRNDLPSVADQAIRDLPPVDGDSPEVWAAL
jgi:hypothetical protein